jgi:hypothetical protein
LESEIRELEGMLKTYLRNPKAGGSMSMARWGRKSASPDGIESELEIARSRLSGIDPKNPLADDRRTKQIEASFGR